jgi:beta-galactosidase
MPTSIQPKTQVKTTVISRSLWGVLAAFVFLTGCASSSRDLMAKRAAPPAHLRERTLLDADWRFHRGDVPSAEQVVAPGYDDAQWQQVHLPHDYVLDETYSDKNARSQGYLPYEVGWYRKHLVIPASELGRVLRLDFDGVFRDSEVWMNGQRLGGHPGGFTPFSFDIGKVAHYGSDNVISVRVDPRQFEGWWYQGGGIYRHVYLTALAPLHVAQWGTYVISKVPDGDKGADAEADLTIQTTVENASGARANCGVVSEILGPDGHSLATIKSAQPLAAGGEHEVVQQARLPHPRLWSVQSPQLYELRTTVLQDGKPVDSTRTTFGIRTIAFDVNKGFFLNGKHVEIYGAANHQDFVATGIAVPDSLQPWRVAQLKKLGSNGWRTAHNPPNEAVLDACDRQGMLVMDENRHLGDTQLQKTPTGTGYSDLSDLSTMIRRDRNHPSVIMWSMCNEENLQGTPEAARIMSAMMDVVHRYDRTRPITSAMNGRGGEKIFLGHGIANVEDIIGVNYNYKSFDAIHQRHPDKPMFGSEDSNEKTTRGEYANDRARGMSSAYNLSEKTWQSIATRPYMAGIYVWTGFDYKGEPNPYGWPDVSNNTGLLDVCGFPKDKGYYFESCWSDTPMVHLMPASWNAAGKEEGKNVRVLAFSNAPRVELFLNGKSLGSKDVPRNGHAEWDVPYQPGQLLAKAYAADAKVAATEQLETTGAPARIILSCDRTTLAADGEDTVVAPVSIVDEKGRVVPDADNRVEFRLEGDGRVLGVGNGNPADHDPDRSKNRKAFHGLCAAVVQAGSRPSHLRLTATSPGLAPAGIELQSR